jgi:hypothetical protein
MTPQERQRVTELFDRLATLENAPRDPEAVRDIANGLSRAPNASYALVQTVLLQAEALDHAEARIRELEGESGTGREGFLDSMRNTLFGREPQRGSVPSVPSVPQVSKWNSGQTGNGGFARQAEPYPQGGATPQGGSFLGTAAAAAVGVIGGGLLFNSLRSMMGGDHGSAFASSYDAPGDRHSPWSGDASGSDLAREAGLNDVGGRSGRFDGGQTAGFMDGSAAADNDDFSADDSGDDFGGFDGGDTSDA